MRTRGAVKQKLRQAVFRHRKKFIDEGLKRRPSNCAHNGAAKLPLKIGQKEVVRVCLLNADDPQRWNNCVCDETMGGDRVAAMCPHFRCRHTADDLKAMFHSILGLDGTDVATSDIGRHYPDVAALTWALGEEETPDEDEWEEDDDG